MRPLRLELEGFTSFRDPTIVDLEGAEFFALVGPTGSGKSTIIDAMCFALYGSVFRLEDRRKVAPVISGGALQARIRFDFTIGETLYTAVRVVRRTASGATTKEARLERDGDTIAGTPEELTAEVTKLLGLSFDHFTRCVVLPQGEFARFLHDKPSERQDLLVNLLSLGIYEQMMQLANNRAAQAKNRVAVAEERLSGELAWATPEALADAKGRVDRLGKLRKEVEQARPQLEEHEAAAAAALEREAQAKRWLKEIDGLRIPEGAAELASRIRDATKVVDATRKAAEAARKDVARLVAARKELPDPEPLRSALAAYERRAALAERLQAARSSHGALEADEAAARKVAEDALSAVTAAQDAIDEINVAEAAYHLAQHLDSGTPCPVCLQDVTTLPKHAKPKGLPAAEKKLAAAEKAHAAATASLEAVVRAVQESAGKLSALQEQDENLSRELKGAPSEKEAAAALGAVADADRALEEARERDDAVRDDLDSAETALRELQEEEKRARVTFNATRDLFAPLGSVPPAGNDLAADWKALVKWAVEQRTVQTKAAALASKEAGVAVAARDSLLDVLTRSCSDCEVQVDGGDFVTAVVAAHTQAAGEVKDLERCIGEAAKLRDEIKELSQQHKLAHSLAQHLSAKPGFFENWIVNEALRRLVVGASSILRDLSNDQYALTIDDAGNFLVADRNNANETRSARTLSGGETFLASLALALALADELAQLASEGSARLEAIFLDEGFGTLDPETLETVAATVENLSAAGRMVGVVTHVRELADRITLQYRVRKDGRSSTVERVDAGISEPAA